MSTCAELERWLDEGRPEAVAAAMSVHAGGCARCGRALAAEAALEAALAAPPAATAPAGFSEVVMARALAARPAGPSPAGAGVALATAHPPRPAWRIALPWLPALGLCAAGAGWAATLAWEAVVELPAPAIDAVPVLEVLGLPDAAGGAAALEAQVEAWLRALLALPPGGQAVAALALSALMTAGAWWLLRRVEGLALGRARA